MDTADDIIRNKILSKKRASIEDKKWLAKTPAFNPNGLLAYDVIKLLERVDYKITVEIESIVNESLFSPLIYIIYGNGGFTPDVNDGKKKIYKCISTYNSIKQRVSVYQFKTSFGLFSVAYKCETINHMGNKDWLYSNYNINIGLKRDKTEKNSVRYLCLNDNGLLKYSFNVKWQQL